MVGDFVVVCHDESIVRKLIGVSWKNDFKMVYWIFKSLADQRSGSFDKNLKVFKTKRIFRLKLRYLMK